jgi:hypothetical protein
MLVRFRTFPPTCGSNVAYSENKTSLLARFIQDDSGKMGHAVVTLNRSYSKAFRFGLTLIICRHS